MSCERRLWLVRHGETEGQSSVRYHGSGDVPLAELGRAQIRALEPWLRAVPFARIVHSPLSRAAESAAILAAQCGLPPELLQVDERLREISFGDCEGMTAAEIAAAFPEFWRRQQAGLADGFPGGEPRSLFAARVATAIRAWAAAPWQDDLLVVSHRGTVRHALQALLGPPPAPHAYGVALGSLTVLRQQATAQGLRWELELLGALPDAELGSDAAMRDPARPA
ncbi:MAG: histidine phosphatase family protein [Planctomycetes bacterium]|nr:histidine phosphatase family protein [Planctomycetota bacterium]